MVRSADDTRIERSDRRNLHDGVLRADPRLARVRGRQLRADALANGVAATYGLTGSIIASDPHAIAPASQVLRFAAGHFHLKDKPTGAVVGQQPFGGARASGTNDKAGSVLNLLRWVSPRAIKETFVPPTDYRYPHMG